jgi:hypothetical protein
MARSVRVDLIADPTRYTRGMRQAERSSRQFTDHTNRAGSAVKAAFAAFSAATVVVEMRRWVDAARDANRVAAQTNAVIASTKGATGLTAKGFSDLAKQISKTAAVDDDLIQGGENILATFTKIRAGGPDRIFERATAAAVDMTAALNGGEVSAEGLKSANLLLGKALQDPIAGLGKLQRAGVSFDDQQKAQIKTWVEHGQVAKAQGLILTEVNKEFGGSAKAAATPAKQLAVTWGNMQEVLGNLLIPAIDKAAVVLIDILDVIDRNRVAFGLLFGVLATGAAVIGTLVVAEKIHRVVVDGIRLATEAWATVQKGLNIILGVTKVQAVTTAAAEGELAAATTAAGASAKTAGANFALFGRLSVGALGAFAAAAAAGAYQGHQLAQAVTEGTKVSGPFAEVRAKILRSIGFEATATKDLTGEQKAANVATGDATVAAAAHAQAQAAAAARTNELSGALKTLQDQFKQQTQAVRDSIQSYDGLIAKSGVTAKEVVGDLHNQVANFRTYSKDVQRLIRAGVNPEAIRELSQKGPQYVHALATGSDKQLAQYQKYWRDRQTAIKGSFAAAMQQQLAGLQRKIRQMQAAINALRGKNVAITGTTSLQFTKSFSQKDWLAARLAAGRMAEGGKIRKGSGPKADDVLIWASKGETVVPADDSRDPGFKRWAAAKGIPGFAVGGIVGINRTDRAYGGVGRMMDHAGTLIMAAGIKKMLAGAGSPAVKAFIRSVDPLPYIWGGAGPGGYDCSGLVGAVALAHRGKPYGHGQRVWTTSSIHPGILGLQAGLGGTLNIGVTSGTGHMAGRYGNLGFEARSTRSGIIVGAGARRPESFSRKFHMAAGGKVDRELVEAFARSGVDIGGDPGKLRINGKVFDRGGYLRPGATLAINRTGRPERVVPGGPVVDYDRLANAIVEALARRPPTVSVDDIHTGLLKKKNGRLGGVKLGLT